MGAGTHPLQSMYPPSITHGSESHDHEILYKQGMRPPSFLQGGHIPRHLHQSVPGDHSHCSHPGHETHRAPVQQRVRGRSGQEDPG